MVPSTALQDAVALLTVAMHAADTDELASLVREFREKDDTDELMLAVVALCRSLCLATSKLIHTVDDSLTDSEADDLSNDELLPVALSVVRAYAGIAAREAEKTQRSKSSGPQP